MKKYLLAFCGLVMASLPVIAQDSAPAPEPPKLGVGSEVSAYPKVQWIKGDPVTQFDKDKIYILECWATWCGPCVASIPHLNELSKKFEGKIIFIGQGVWEEEKADVEKFVKEKGDEMSYRVAFSGGDDADFAKEWLKPAGVRGIPATFVIQDNKIVWTTHPINLSEEGLQLLVDRKFTKEAAMALSPQKKFDDIEALIKDGKLDEANSRLDAILAKEPKAQSGHYLKMDVLKKQGKEAEAFAFAKDLYTRYPEEGKGFYFNALMEKKDYATVLALTDADLKKDPANIGTLFTRYKVYVEQNDYKSAAAMINKAAAASDDPKALSNLAMLNSYVRTAKRGTEAEAAMIKAGKKSLSLKPANLQLGLSLAKNLWEKDKAGAKQIMAQTADAMKKDPKQAKYAGVAAQVAESLNKDVMPDDKQLGEWYKAASK